jgi:hypothetical protein
MCWVTRGLLWRGLGILTTQIQNFVFPAQGQILFGQASYSAHHYMVDLDALHVIISKFRDTTLVVMSSKLCVYYFLQVLWNVILQKNWL